ncbi:hypothetical protein [Mycobacterium liflandii]|nr:hypothetical protein [Mycobacterium liflandii]
MVLTQPGLRSGSMGLFSLFLPVMMMVSFAGVFMQGRMGGADNKVLSPQVLEEERRAFLAELDQTREVVQGDASRQFANFQFLHPEPSLLRGLVGSPRMWGLAPRDPRGRRYSLMALLAIAVLAT